MIKNPTLGAQAAPPQPSSAASAASEEALRRTATAFEAAFLAEMLGHAGLGQTPAGFGGGPGEEAFASLLVREQARLMAEAGGVGVAEAVFAALAKMEAGS